MVWFVVGLMDPDVDACMWSMGLVDPGVDLNLGVCGLLDMEGGSGS